jgi:hypothetical protein
LHEKIREKINLGEYEDLKQLNEDWDLMRKFYFENLKGPAINYVSDKFGFSKY